MADFDTEESSVENSQPVEVYHFRLGVEEFLYTSAEDSIVVDSRTYEPVEIERGPIAMGKSKRAQILTVKLASSNVLAQRYVGPPPGTRAAVTISRVQRGDTSLSPALIYSGTIKAVKFPANGQFAEMQIQTVEASTDRAVPRFTYMGMCNHLLYDAACGVIQDDFKHQGIVTSISGADITVAGLNASGLGAVGGFVDSVTGAEKRQILAQSGDTITIMLPFESDPSGTLVSVFAGCDRVLKSDCAVKFNKEINFGGFAFVPKRNPFVAGL